MMILIYLRVDAPSEVSSIVVFLPEQPTFLETQKLKHSRGGVVYGSHLFVVFAVEVSSVVQKSKNDRNCSIFDSHMKTSLTLAILRIWIASTLEEKISKIEIRVIDSPPHGIGPVGHHTVIYFFVCHHNT